VLLTCGPITLQPPHETHLHQGQEPHNSAHLTAYELHSTSSTTCTVQSGSGSPRGGTPA
jgi:hypothetical protein